MESEPSAEIPGTGTSAPRRHGRRARRLTPQEEAEQNRLAAAAEQENATPESDAPQSDAQGSSGQESAEIPGEPDQPEEMVLTADEASHIDAVATAEDADDSVDGSVDASAEATAEDVSEDPEADGAITEGAESWLTESEDAGESAHEPTEAVSSDTGASEPSLAEPDASGTASAEPAVSEPAAPAEIPAAESWTVPEREAVPSVRKGGRRARTIEVEEPPAGFDPARPSAEAQAADRAVPASDRDADGVQLGEMSVGDAPDPKPAPRFEGRVLHRPDRSAGNPVVWIVWGVVALAVLLLVILLLTGVIGPGVGSALGIHTAPDITEAAPGAATIAQTWEVDPA